MLLQELVEDYDLPILEIKAAKDFTYLGEGYSSHGAVLYLADPKGTKHALKIVKEDFVEVLERECLIYQDLTRQKAAVPRIENTSPHAALFEYIPECKNSGLSFLLDTAKALETIHQAGYIHRDVKPSNIRSSRLIDFELSHKPGAKVIPKGGTLPYVAPEVIYGEPVSFSADIYAFGCLMAEVLNGIRLPDSRDMSSDLFLFLQPLDYCHNFIVDCTKKDATKRPGILEVVFYLEKALGSNIFN